MQPAAATGARATHRECDDERADECGQVDDGGDDALHGEHVLQLAHGPEQEGRAARGAG